MPNTAPTPTPRTFWEDQGSLGGTPDTTHNIISEHLSEFIPSIILQFPLQVSRWRRGKTWGHFFSEIKAHKNPNGSVCWTIHTMGSTSDGRFIKGFTSLDRATIRLLYQFDQTLGNPKITRINRPLDRVIPKLYNKSFWETKDLEHNLTTDTALPQKVIQATLTNFAEFNLIKTKQSIWDKIRERSEHIKTLKYRKKYEQAIPSKQTVKPNQPLTPTRV